MVWLAVAINECLSLGRKPSRFRHMKKLFDQIQNRIYMKDGGFRPSQIEWKVIAEVTDGQ
jgi:hypothetical protein